MRKHIVSGTGKNSPMAVFCAGLLTCVFLLVFLTQTAQAETTYVITDGNQTLTHTTHSTDPAKVLNEAGIILNTEDSYKTSEGGSQIIVRRAVPVMLSERGVSRTVKAGEETVGELLHRLGIKMDPDTVISQPEDAPVNEGMEISVDQVITRVENYTMEIPFTTSYVYEDSMARGEAKVITEGVPGELGKKAQVTYVNGKETKREILEEKTVREPIAEVIAVGSRLENPDPEKPVIGDGKIILPTGEVLTYYKTGQFVATAYTQNGLDVNDITATGSKVHKGVVAVDPDVIPYGTRMFIVANDGSYVYGLSTAEDCGGAIQNNRLDLYFDTADQCFQFGVRDCTVYFLGDANWR